MKTNEKRNLDSTTASVWQWLKQSEGILGWWKQQARNEWRAFVVWRTSDSKGNDPIEAATVSLAASLCREIPQATITNEAVRELLDSQAGQVGWEAIAELLIEEANCRDIAPYVKEDHSSEAKDDFELGHVCSTPNALESLSFEDIATGLSRHTRGDWGDLCQEDKDENDFAIGKYLRLFSAYHSANGVKFWIITEADRSATTVLLPSDY